MVGPFTFADVMGPEDLSSNSPTGVDAHPHIGLAAITYLLAGRIVHRDSTGVVQVVDPGAVNWMTSGSGLCHTERSHPDDVEISRPLHGIQAWAALPYDHENITPCFEHLDPQAVPAVNVGESSIRLAVGTGWGMRSSIGGYSPMILAELRLAGSAIPVPPDHAERAIVAMTGAVTINNRPVPLNHLVVLTPGEQVKVDGHGGAIVLGGEPIGPRTMWWNFVHSDPDRIEQAKDDWENQRFPIVPGDHEPWIPLPDRKALGGQ